MAPVWFGLALMIVGIVLVWGSKQLPPLLTVFVWWTGVILLVIGLILVLTQPLLWLNSALRAAMGV